MARYVSAADGDAARALELYAHHARLHATLWQTIGHVEVVVRNAMHDALSVRSEDWYDTLRLGFNDETRADIAKARQRVSRYQRPETPGHVVAELNLGFWRFLLSKYYDRLLWTPYLHRAFPGHSGDRSDLFNEMKRLNDDRNAVAHHQRVADPTRTRRRCVRIAGYVCSDAAAWIDEECRVLDVLAERP